MIFKIFLVFPKLQQNWGGWRYIEHLEVCALSDHGTSHSIRVCQQSPGQGQVQPIFTCSVLGVNTGQRVQ